jgi:predicted branched-subunit amino acid permease
MAALQLLRNDVFSLSIVLTALVINLRFLMYSASLAPYLHNLPRRWKWSMSYMLSDQSYALSIMKLSSLGGFGQYFYAGTAVSMWLSWQLSVLAGVLLGSSVPGSWSLDFAIPLSFLAILIPAIRDSAALSAALAGGIVAVLVASLPYNLGLVVASICGILTGLVVERFRKAVLSRKASMRAEGQCK